MDFNEETKEEIKNNANSKNTINKLPKPKKQNGLAKFFRLLTWGWSGKKSKISNPSRPKPVVSKPGTLITVRDVKSEWNAKSRQDDSFFDDVSSKAIYINRKEGDISEESESNFDDSDDSQNTNRVKQQVYSINQVENAKKFREAKPDEEISEMSESQDSNNSSSHTSKYINKSQSSNGLK